MPLVSEIPEVRRLAVADVPGGPHERSVLLMLGPGGRAAFEPETRDFGSLAMLRPGDRAATPVGRIGRGPGELALPVPVGFTDSSLFVWDLASALVTEWDATGRQIRDLPGIGAVRPVAIIADRGLVGVDDRANGFDVLLVDLLTGEKRRIVSSDDPAIRSLFVRRDGKMADTSLRAPRKAIAAWPGGLVVGDGWSYRIAVFDWTGRLVAKLGRDLGDRFDTPTEIEGTIRRLRSVGLVRTSEDSLRFREALSTRRREWFVPTHPPRPDHRGRIWVVVDLGDDAAADVFDGGIFLGRVPIPCQGFDGNWGLAGDLIALTCTTSDPNSDRGVELRWFRIVEKDSTRR